MQSRFIYLCLKIIVKLHYSFQFLLSFFASFFENSLRVPVVNQKLTNIYLGSKVFSNYSIEPGRNIAIIDISTLQDYRYDNSLLILNNNDFCDKSCYFAVSKIRKYSSNLQIIIWDFDNHHMLANSIRLMFLSNVYFGAHPHNSEFLRRTSSNYFGFIPAGVIQWPKEFLTSHIQSMLSTSRSNELFGPHIFYPTFTRRNKIIELVSTNFSKVCFSNINYHNRSLEDRFAEWCLFKVHLIVPVDHDLPIRLLDALVTGGIPLVPIKLKSSLHALSLDRFIVFYDECKLDALQLKVDEAIMKFDDEGLEGMLVRVNYVLDQHHIDSRINFLINLCP